MRDSKIQPSWLARLRNPESIHPCSRRVLSFFFLFFSLRNMYVCKFTYKSRSAPCLPHGPDLAKFFPLPQLETFYERSLLVILNAVISVYQA